MKVKKRIPKKSKQSPNTVESSIWLDEVLDEKARKLERFFEGRVEVSWSCSKHRGLHCAKIKVIGPQFVFKAMAQHDSLYTAAEMALVKVQQQVQKEKTKRRQKIHRRNLENPRHEQLRERTREEIRIQELLEQEAA